ncbi:endodeoxyribonuclease RusA [[Actinobacillus] muris]|uniref:Crossover junction endodeoxyribonuclease rusA n=1 Tax=Muribacter muris TaxID=67855 RepID=A0A0J5S273_9PAST|nr:RusA family crossover junction endodeoxyribonuclease [Muribacter muris]KMK50922.1 endodeoxyribonuclease RusA [[Actinobacillus] muris] [Muribacter muris]
MVTEVILELPYPPTVNHYWKHTRSGIHYVTAKGKAFQQAVCLLVKNAKQFKGKVALVVDIYPPDKRKRDIDNVFKALFDGLVKSGVIADDSLIDKLTAEKFDAVKGGKVVVRIRELQ